MMSTSVSGKVIAMWMPIPVFFYMGFEHSIGTCILFPSGLMLGGNFTFMDYMIWNEIPTVLGNLVGGLTFVGRHAVLHPLQDRARAPPERPAGRGTSHDCTLAVTLGQASPGRRPRHQPGFPTAPCCPRGTCSPARASRWPSPTASARAR